MKRALLWLPILAFAILFLVIAYGLLRPAERTVRSAMIGQPLPAFALPGLVPGKPGVASADFGNGRPRLLNVFASWCVPCITEAPILLHLKAQGIEIEGIAVRDTAPALRGFLAQHGDAYARIGDDGQSQVQLSLGSSGVPESFVIDGKGRIVLQHIGEIHADDVPAIIAAVRSAR